MASATIQAISACAGGGHITFRITQGARVVDVVLPLEEINADLSQEEFEGFARVICKLAALDRTRAQLRATLQAGVTVVA